MRVIGNKRGKHRLHFCMLKREWNIISGSNLHREQHFFSVVKIPCYIRVRRLVGQGRVYPLLVGERFVPIESQTWACIQVKPDIIG